MSSSGDKKYASCARETPIGVDKMFSTPIGDSSRFSGKEENRLISVINTCMLDQLKKMNGKKLDFLYSKEVR